MNPITPGSPPKKWRRPERPPLPGPIGRAARAVLGPPLRQTQPDHREEFVHLLTRRFRLLPDFLIIGTQKGGTTSLFSWLSRHPNVGRPTAKEVEYFDVHFGNSVSWYRAHFPARRERVRSERAGAKPYLIGEATPSYLLDPRVPGRVASVLPKVKLIALLRNPVDRAYSLYQHRVDQGNESLSFEDAIAAEPERLRGEVERVHNDPSYESVPLREFCYAYGGMYADRLREWFDVFPRDRFLILRSEDLFTAPRECFTQALDFLALPHGWEPEAYAKINPGVYTDGMSRATRVRLIEHFRPHNRRLAELLGRDFDWND